MTELTETIASGTNWILSRHPRHRNRLSLGIDRPEDFNARPDQIHVTLPLSLLDELFRQKDQIREKLMK